MQYVILAVLFLAHAAILKQKGCSLLIAYLSASLAWLAMMSFTVFLAFQTPGPNHSSTMAIAVMLTPFFYTRLLVIPYVIGIVLGSIIGALRE